MSKTKDIVHLRSRHTKQTVHKPSRRKRKQDQHEDTGHQKDKKGASLLIIIGAVCLGISFLIFILTFYPVIKEEILYFLYRGKEDVTIISSDNPSEETKENTIIPESEDFGIIIPKIRANAQVIPNVDPYNEKEYQYQLSQGVAHAKGSVFPGQTGNVFLFAHSAGNFYEANRYNAVFYLLTKLKKEDEIIIMFEKEQYTYKVADIKIVDAHEVQYLQTKEAKETVTLMTCWPAGTTFQRLLVIGERVQK